jgi:uncharacterized protein
MKSLLIGMIKVYRAALSPFFGNCCRFHPSCSAYSIAAIEQHGCCKGVALTALRLAKCHPFHPGGVDLVPEPELRVGHE